MRLLEIDPPTQIIFGIGGSIGFRTSFEMTLLISVSETQY